MRLQLHDGYRGEQLHIEGGGFQKLKYLGLRNLRGLNRLIIDEGALPLLQNLDIGECPQLKEVPSSIQHLKSLKNLQLWEMPTEFVLSLQPDEGLDFGKVKHIPSVTFRIVEASGKVIRGGPKCPHHFQKIEGFKCQCFKDFQVLNQPEHQ
nr:putative disease resistance rpp8-like protein 4 [Quercus suber]